MPSGSPAGSMAFRWYFRRHGHCPIGARPRRYHSSPSDARHFGNRVFDGLSAAGLIPGDHCVRNLKRGRAEDPFDMIYWIIELSALATVIAYWLS
jgi:hypothetical protein